MKVSFEQESLLEIINDMSNFLKSVLGGESNDNNGGLPLPGDGDDEEVPVPGSEYAWLDKYTGRYDKKEPLVKALWRIIPNLKDKYNKERIVVKMPRYAGSGKMMLNEHDNPVLLNPKETKDKLFLYPKDAFWGWRRSFQADNFRAKELCDPEYGAVPEIFVELVGELRDGEFIPAT